MSELEALVSKSNVFLISEGWLNDVSVINVSGNSIYRKDRGKN